MPRIFEPALRTIGVAAGEVLYVGDSVTSDMAAARNAGLDFCWFNPGGDPVPAGQAPSFLIRAMRDPDGANLDRVQVVKGWLDAGGETHERIYDVAVSDGRAIGADGRCKTPVGSTVDVEKATWTNARWRSRSAPPPSGWRSWPRRAWKR